MQTFTKDQVHLTKVTAVEIVTSGYDDRFLSYTSTFHAKVYTEHGHAVDLQFTDKEKVINFLTYMLGFSITDAFDMLPEEQYQIAGKSNSRTWTGKNITQTELATIDAYLRLRQRNKYTLDAIQRWVQLLRDHPLDPDVIAIVQWQIKQCDQQNVETWGHKDGHYAAMKAQQ